MTMTTITQRGGKLMFFMLLTELALLSWYLCSLSYVLTKCGYFKIYREDAIFTDLESFPDSMQRVSDMPQDGYGLMISELLEADIPNSSVSTGVNSMHNEMGLPNEEVCPYFLY